MKTLTIYFMIVLMTIFMGCGGGGSDGTVENSSNTPVNDESEVTPPIIESSTDFLFLYRPTDINQSKSIQVVSINSTDQLSTELIEDGIYPPNRYGGSPNYIADIDAYGDIYAMSLHQDFNLDGKQGIAGSLSSKTYTYLPLVYSSRSSIYSYFEESSQKVTESGHIFYIAATDNRYYGDEYNGYYMRYNLETNSSDQAISCKSFILDQPEKGADTETCLIKNHYVPSVDGKKIYSAMSGFGLEGNMYHYDYTILFEYDFENESYKRLGETEDTNVYLLGATSDVKNIIYNSSNQVKVLNLDTNSVKVINNIIHHSEQASSQWNNSGMIYASSVALYYCDYLNDKEITIVPNRVTNAQFSKDGSSIYFRFYDDNERTLYKTDDLSENSNYSEVFKIPEEYGNIFLIKGNNSSVE